MKKTDPEENFLIDLHRPHPIFPRWAFRWILRRKSERTTKMAVNVVAYTFGTLWYLWSRVEERLRLRRESKKFR